MNDMDGFKICGIQNKDREYALQIQQLIKERDELRAQVANLYDALQQSRRIALNATKKDLTPQEKLASIEILALHALNKTPHDVAQYVRGLEDALQFYAEGFDDGDYQPDYVNPGMKWVTKAEQDQGQRAKQALAVKEQ